MFSIGAILFINVNKSAKACMPEDKIDDNKLTQCSVIINSEKKIQSVISYKFWTVLLLPQIFFFFFFLIHLYFLCNKVRFSLSI